MSEDLTVERDIFFNEEVGCPKNDYVLIPLEGYQTKGCYDCEFFQGGTLNKKGWPVVLCSWKGENMQNDTRNKPYIDPANIDWGYRGKKKQEEPIVTEYCEYLEWWRELKKRIRECGNAVRDDVVNFPRHSFHQGRERAFGDVLNMMVEIEEKK